MSSVKRMKVSVVIPNWNGRDKLMKNLAKVLVMKAIDEVVVSDDASTDDSVELVRKEYPEVKLVVRDTNGGFSSNVNFGVKNTTGDLVFLLNTDAVPDENCLESILPHFADRNVFSVGCNVGGSWSWARWQNGWVWHNQYGKNNEDLTHQTLWASGGSGVFRKEYWDELGGMDELMNPFYVEDVDLGYRATKRGYLNIFEPRAVVEHYKEKGVIEEHFSVDTVSKTAERNMLIFIWKNITDQGMLLSHIINLILRLILHPKFWVVFWEAIVLLPKIIVKRQIEQKNARLTDKEIFGKYDER